MAVVLQDGDIVYFQIRKTTQVHELMAMYCTRQRICSGQIRFLFYGRRLRDEQTPEDLEMEDDDLIEAIRYQGAGRIARDYMENHVASSIPSPHAIVPVSTEISVTLHADRGRLSSSQVPWIPEIPLHVFVNATAADTDGYGGMRKQNAEYRGRISPWTHHVLRHKFHVVVMDAADVPRVGGSLEYHCERNNGSYYGGDEHSWQRYTKQMPIDGFLEVNEDMRTLHFKPVSPLRPNQLYAIVLQHYAMWGLGCCSDLVIPFATLPAPEELLEKVWDG